MNEVVERATLWLRECYSYCVKEELMFKKLVVMCLLTLTASCYAESGMVTPEIGTQGTGTLAQSYRSGTFTIEAQWDSTLVVTPQVKSSGDAAIQWWADALADNDLPSLASVPAWRFHQCGVEPPTDHNVDMVIRVESQRVRQPSAVVSCRRTAGLPFTGVIRLPRETFADSVADEPSADFVKFVVRHEMAHVFGIGYWHGGDVVVVNGSIVVGGGRYFAGDSATAMYRTLSGNKAPYGVPLDYNGIQVNDWHNRTQQSDHWRFSALPNDAMIPYYLPSEQQAMSAVTLAALVDLGWQVDMSKAEQWIDEAR